MRPTQFRVVCGTLVIILPALVGLAENADNRILSPRTEPGKAKSRSVPAGWWAKIEEDIRRSEYDVTWQRLTPFTDIKAAFQAPNRTHNLRTYFTTEGVRVIPRTGSRSAWQWTVRLVGYGRAGAVHEPPAARPAISTNRVEYARGNLTEWYTNSNHGLEQGFTLHASPAELSGGHHPVQLDLRIGGDLNGTLNIDKNRVEFCTRGGVGVLHYGDLKAADATGRVLPAHIMLANSTLSISVDDLNALYPVVIDPLATSPTWTAESDQAVARFGTSVATAGDVNGDGYSDVVVGANGYDGGETDEGRAYVYYGSATGLSTTPDWIAEGDQASASFGQSVATAGDVNGDGYSDLVIGAYNYDHGETDEGRAFVYYGSATGLSTTPDWVAEGDQASASFGMRVSTAGDVNGDGYSDVLIGAPLYTNGQYQEGRAFVYHGSAAGLEPTPAWTGEINVYSALFGCAVSAACDVNGDGYGDVIIGARFDGPGQAGRAYVFHGSAAGLSATPSWIGGSDQAAAGFGFSVSTAGDVNGDGYGDVIVGVRYYDNDQTDEGQVCVYHGSASGLSATPAWTAEGDQASASFGQSVGAAGDVNGDGFNDVIIGAFVYDNGQVDEGRAYVYYGSGNGLSTTPGWVSEGDQENARFGTSVASAGDIDGDGYSDVIVGASLYDNGEIDEGRAFVYRGSPAGLSSTPGWAAESNQARAYFGCSVSTAGDVNGDGYSDVVVGAYDYDNGETDEGRAFVYQGSAVGLAASPAWTAEVDLAYAHFGYSVSSAGDVNGDGFSDVIVGAYDYAVQGRAFVYHGSSSGLSTAPAWTAGVNDTSSYFGFSVSNAGDVNGDGFGDVIVGAYGHGGGRAFVYSGSVGGLDTAPAWIVECDQAEAGLGHSVSTAGDVNGDGFDDVIVGAVGYDNGESYEGRAYVYEGSAVGLNTSPAWVAEGNRIGAGFGDAVSTAGDVNGDGYSDVIIGALSFGDTYTGKAYVYYGSSTGLGTSPDWAVEGDQDHGYFGSSVSSAGDVNGDGYSDIVVGAYGYDGGQVDDGRAYVYHGSATGLSSTPNWTAESNQASASFGRSVSMAGDVNGDGYGDVIVGAPYYNSASAEVDEGSAYVYYGNNGCGLSLRPQQRQSDDSAPIDVRGRSASYSSFRLAILGRSPYGRGRLGLEWEVKPRGTLFNGEGTGISSADADTGVSGAPISELVNDLSASTAYHSRLRLVYDPASIPWMTHSRWLTLPGNGWNETDLRTASCSLYSLDFDKDCDIDNQDLLQFIACSTGPQVTGQPGSDCSPAQFEAADSDGDADVDSLDFAVLQRCYGGENRPTDPACASE